MWEELLPPLIIGIIVVVFYIYSWSRDKSKTKIAVRKSLKIFLVSMPIFVFALILMGLLMNDYIMPPEWVEQVLGPFDTSGLQGIFIGTMLGFPLPGPRYAIYPIANALIAKHAGMGTIAALICGQQIIDVPEGMFIEIKMMCTRFFAFRTLTAVIVVFMAGVLTEIIDLFLIFNVPGVPWPV